ncbi:MAG: radical SAM protein [Deltaproteobacteria bacterium]|nr:radical SAM protein [Deltaproteobacteria bacterium]
MTSTTNFSIGWGLTNLCNMSCDFCYSKPVRRVADHIDFDKEMTLKEWIDFVDNNHKFIVSINYGTGENTLISDWYELIKYIRGNYPTIEQALTTNGTLYDQISRNKEFHKIVVESIDEIDVSLDFYDPNRHNKFRGNTNAYDWTLKTLDFCNEYNIEPTIVFLGAKEILEIENLEGLFGIAKKYNSKLRTNIYRPTGGINEFSKRFIVDYKQIINVLLWINKHHKIVSLQDTLLHSVLCADLEETDEKENSPTSLRILPNGYITPSTYLISKKYQIMNITQGKIHDHIHESSIFKEVNTGCVPKYCKSINCQFLKICRGGVVDRRYLWYGTLEERDYYCPYRKEGDLIPETKIHITKESSFSSIHEDYLPTMFFQW